MDEKQNHKLPELPTINVSPDKCREKFFIEFVFELCDDALKYSVHWMGYTVSKSGYNMNNLTVIRKGHKKHLLCK
jgi:hypothetical protein